MYIAAYPESEKLTAPAVVYLCRMLHRSDYPLFHHQIMQSEDPDAQGSTLVTKGPPVPQYHPMFNLPEADVVLGAKDGVMFRVHSFTLKTTSGWFASMFSLPQKDDHSSPVTVYLDEDSPTLEVLLRCVCGLALPQLESYAVVEPLLFAAEKYDMPGPLSIVRALVMTPPLLSDPLRLFVMACRYGWEDVVRLAAKETLTLNLFDAVHRPVLQKLHSVPLLSLLELHRARRDKLKQQLNEPPFVNDQGPSSCSHCGSVVEYHTWRDLKHAIIMEMDVRPLGDTICEAKLMDGLRARSCWDARCATCQRVLYDKKETLVAISTCINALPTEIE